MSSRSLIAVLLLVLFGTGLVGPAQAHTASSYYPREWVTDRSQSWWFISSFPTGAYRDRVRDGVSQWNSQAQTMTFTYAGERSSYDPYVCGHPYGKNSVFWRSIDGSGGTLGITARCQNGTEILTSQLLFDSEEEWCTGTGDCYDGVLGLGPGFGANMDLWSIASHEWGHMTGFRGPYYDGHFDDTAAICEDTDAEQQTMCPYYHAGSERMRTTNTHDEHTFQAAY